MVQGYPQSTLLAVAASRTKDKGGPTLSSMPTLRYLPYTLFWDTIRSACGSNGSHVFYVRIQLSSQWESVSLTPLLNLPSLLSSPPGFSTVLVTLSLDLCSVCCPPFAFDFLYAFVSSFARFRRHSLPLSPPSAILSLLLAVSQRLPKTILRVLRFNALARWYGSWLLIQLRETCEAFYFVPFSR